MSKLWLFLLKKSASKNKGFSLFEVLVSILVTSAFIMGTLQAMAINAFLQVKAERESQANFWIQEDMEQIQAVAASATLSNLGVTKNICTLLSSTATANQKFGGLLITKLNTYSTSFNTNIPLQMYTTDTNGNTTFQTNKKPNWTPIYYSGTTPKIATVQVVGERKLLNKNYRLVRIAYTDKNTKYNVAQITYRVGEPYDSTNSKQTDLDQDKLADDTQGKTSIMVKNYAEVSPAAINECK
jgi:type II secretory pathway pseudopilin PulG